ncbi:MAG: CRISPR-associated helicase Cas3' [Trichlorobacter sp.]|nr:CRISPR-associated helicase Cas3' [Trichlorobacter sp.]
MSYFRYWGKAENEGARYHLLPYHCLDVAAVGWVLFAPEKPLCQRLAVDLVIPPETLQRLMSFFLSEHDIGKFAVAFQGVKPDMSQLLIPPNINKQYTERHDSLGFLLWFDEGGLRERLGASEELCKLFAGSDMARLPRSLDIWMEIVTGHHGIPPKRSGPNRSNYFDKQDEEAALQYLCATARLFLTPNDIASLNCNEFGKRLKRLSWVLAGLVVLADWLGSSRQPDSFCQSRMSLHDYWNHQALPFAAQAMHDARLEPASIAPYVNTRHLFDFVTTLTPLQQWAEQVELSSRNQLFILEDVTGAGKTEAALTLAHRLMAQGLADGLYVALPTMATSNAMYERLGAAYRRLYAADALPSIVLAHGARHLSKLFRTSLALPEDYGLQQHYGKDDESIEAYCSAWLADSRKKALLADVGVGTLDQALLAVLPARHQSLRCLGLNHKILIVDEVHSFDPYMNKLLRSLLEYHASQGGSAILLSATLPYDMRCEYLEAFCVGTGGETPELKNRQSYPLTTHCPALNKTETALCTRREVKRTVAVTLLDSAKDVLATIREAVEQDKCVCWVRNTVGSAIKAYRKLARQTWLEKDRLSLFHSRFAMIDRQRIEDDTLKLFGKSSTAEMRRGRVLIATQVVEQSLDLDFDVMISDLAPIDLLIQRMGREHRHVRDTSGNRLYETDAVDQRDAPVFYLFGPPATETPEENWLNSTLPGTQKVYENVGQLWLTQRLLARMGKVSMPEDARSLIEGVYGSNVQQSIPDALYNQTRNAVGTSHGKECIADLNVLKFAKGYCRTSSADWGGEEEVDIPTRLGDDTVRIALVVTDDDGWRPYAEETDFPWDRSMLNVPENSWLKARKQISATIKASLDAFRSEVKALKWVEPFPLTTELSAWYDTTTGWGIHKEEANEPD